MSKITLTTPDGQVIGHADNIQIETVDCERSTGGFYKPVNSAYHVTVEGVRMCDEMVLDDAQRHRLAQIINGDVTDEREHIKSDVISDVKSDVMSVVREAVMGANMLSDVEKEYVMFRIDEAMKEI